MSDGGEKKPPRQAPLWHYKVNVGRTPPPPKPRGGPDGLPAREIRPEDLEPLRLDTEWRPSLILRELGPAPTESEYLPRLVVAAAILQGVHRILELSERLLSLFKIAYPRCRTMLNEESLAPRRELLQDLFKRINAARFELVQTRARAANDMEGDPQSPDGLRLLDLLILVSHTETGLLAHEVTSRRNLTGIDFGATVARMVPVQRYAEEWLERLFGTAQMHGVLFFTPPDYGRVLLVYSDGRLAYDPAYDPNADDPAG